jgi:peroxiredoxin
MTTKKRNAGALLGSLMLLAALAWTGMNGWAAEMGQGTTPNVGTAAPDFTLATPEGTPVKLSALTAKGTVVLVVLRGFPGYQCPYCQKQAHDFQLKADQFHAAGAELLLVYPGPPDELSVHAKEFLAPAGTLPGNFHLVIDPSYTFTNQYGLRWEAPHETAYPTTFVIDRRGVVRFRKISHQHGDRTTADDVLAEVDKAH